MSTVWAARARVSLKTVWVCSPATMERTDDRSASWPVVTGSGRSSVP